MASQVNNGPPDRNCLGLPHVRCILRLPRVVQLPIPSCFRRLERGIVDLHLRRRRHLV
jgi:hypothetical protein